MKNWLISGVLFLMILLSACSGKGKSTLSPEQVYTQAAETVQAQLTLMAEEITTPTVLVTKTDQPIATATPQVTKTTAPTATTDTQPTKPSACVNRATFVEDITYPDGAQVSPGEQFIKTWKMMNAGTCTWTINYKIVFINSDGISSPTESPLTTGIEVPPGAQININMNLKAPETEGTYTAYFKFKAPDGTIFGINSDGAVSFYAKVKVTKTEATSTATVNPTETPAMTVTPTPSS